MARTTTYEIADHHMIQFTTNVELLLQQKQPTLLPYVTQASYTGIGSQKVLQFGEVEMSDFEAGTSPGNWMGDTVWDSLDHHQRWVNPKSYTVSLPIHDEDQKRMIANPKSPYAEAMRAAWARKVDKTIITAAFGNNTVGTFDDPISTPFGASNIIPAGGDGLTIEKLRDARQLMVDNYNDPNQVMYIATSFQQINDLLGTTEVTSADFNTVRALVNGALNTFVGFEFIWCPQLPSNAAGERSCLVWVKDGLHLGQWGSLRFETTDRADKNYTTQLWMSGTIGATRTQENKLVRIDCVDPTAV